MPSRRKSRPNQGRPGRRFPPLHSSRKILQEKFLPPCIRTGSALHLAGIGPLGLAKEADMNFDHLGPSAIFWGALLLMCFFMSFFGYLERKSRYRAIEKMVEKGQTVPPEMLGRSALPYDRRAWHYQHPASSGIFLMCIGVALAIFFWAMQGGGNLIDDGRMNNWLPVIGIFPFMVGLARLLSAGFERRPPNPGS
jgi:hypothetical protein